MGQGHGKKKSLKAGLQAHQARLQARQKAVHVAQGAEQKGKQRRTQNARSSTVPFRPTDKILLVGEGNFSFTRALLVDPPSVLEHLPPANVTATSYDSEEDCYAKYTDARQIVDIVRSHGAQVLFGVDATRLHGSPALKGRRWDRIVWNFPHAGKAISDQDRNILSNQRLVLDFFRCAPHFLAHGHDSDGARGTVLVTLRNVPPYTLWDVPRLAKTPPRPLQVGETPNPRYRSLRSFVFHRELWKGYEHRMTKGERAHGRGTPGVGGEDRTWEFCLQD